MENNVNQRIILLKDSLNLTDFEFCNCVKISTGTLHRIKNNEKVSNKVMKSIIDYFGVSLNWLIDGTGEMDVKIKKDETNDNPWKDALVSQLKDENHFLKDQIKMMREMLQVLKPSANFRNGNALAGFYKAGVSVRV